MKVRIVEGVDLSTFSPEKFAAIVHMHNNDAHDAIERGLYWDKNDGYRRIAYDRLDSAYQLPEAGYAIVEMHANVVMAVKDNETDAIIAVNQLLPGNVVVDSGIVDNEGIRHIDCGKSSQHDLNDRDLALRQLSYAIVPLSLIEIDDQKTMTNFRA